MVPSIRSQLTTSATPQRAQSSASASLVGHAVDSVEARLARASASVQRRRAHFERLRDWYEGQAARLGTRPEAGRALRHCQARVREISETIWALDRVLTNEVQVALHGMSQVRCVGHDVPVETGVAA
jgi:hypothetical protein